MVDVEGAGVVGSEEGGLELEALESAAQRRCWCGYHRGGSRWGWCN